MLHFLGIVEEHMEIEFVVTPKLAKMVMRLSKK